MPVLFSAYLDERHFAMSVAGAIATGESAGLVIGSALSIRLMRGIDVPLRTVVICVLCALIAVQLLSACFHAALPFGAVRVTSGICVGAVQSIGAAWISPRRHSERLFAIYIAMTFLAGTIGMPFFAFALLRTGLSGSFLIFAALIGIAALVAVRYPRRLNADAPQERDLEAAGGGSLGRYSLALLLASMVMNFTLNGGLWIFLDQIGQHAGLEHARVAVILGAGMFAALGVTAAVGVFGNRFGRLRSLLFAHACLAAGSLILLVPALLPFTCAVIVFHVGLAVISPYYLASLAAIKPSQRSVLCGVAAMNLGFTIGPWVVSMLVDAVGYSAVLTLGTVLFGVSLALVLMAFDGRMPGFRLRRMG